MKRTIKGGEPCMVNVPGKFTGFNTVPFDDKKFEQDVKAISNANINNVTATINGLLNVDCIKKVKTMIESIKLTNNVFIESAKTQGIDYDAHAKRNTLLDELIETVNSKKLTLASEGLKSSSEVFYANPMQQSSEPVTQASTASAPSKRVDIYTPSNAASLLTVRQRQGRGGKSRRKRRNSKKKKGTRR